MNSLSQYHPFRDNVNKTADASATVVTDNTASKDDREEDSRSKISLKTKVRLAIGFLGFMGLWMVLSSTFSGETLPQNGFYSILDRDGVKNNKTTHSVEQSSNGVFDEHDLDERGRNVSEAKSKAGILSSLFCKGGKKASFCD